MHSVARLHAFLTIGKKVNDHFWVKMYMIAVEFDNSYDQGADDFVRNIGVTNYREDVFDRFEGFEIGLQGIYKATDDNI